MTPVRPLVEGPIRPAIVALAAPVIAGEALHAGFHLVDLAWVGPLGTWATGAITTSMFSLWIAFALGNLVVTGLGAHVSRAIGAGDAATAGHAGAQATWLALLLGVPMMALGWWGSPHLFAALGADAQVSAAGTGYLRVVALGMPVLFLSMTAGAIMRACGNTRLPMLVTAAAVLANAALDPLLIYGLGPLPAMGVTGSAVATVACMVGAVAAYGCIALRGHPDLPLRWAPPDGRMLWGLVRVGAPYAAVGCLFSVVYLWYARIAAAFGPAAIAIIGIGNRLEAITYLTSDGFAVASSTFVGQNLGAGRPDRAARGAWTAVGLMSVVGLVVGAAFIAVPEQLVGLFTRDPQALALGATWMRILGLCQLATGVEGVIGGAFAGAGNTLPPMVVHVSVAILRIPLASWAAFDLGLGVTGVAWTMCLTCVVRGTILTAWFARGRWKTSVLPGARAPLPAAAGPEEVEPWALREPPA